MSGPRSLVGLALVGLLSAPALASAGDVYSYVDADGVVHFSNAPDDPRYKRVHRSRSGGGVYQSGSRPQARARRASSDRQREWREHIAAAAQRYALPEALLLAVMSVESNFDQRALSEKGAMGLMQLMPGTAKDMFVSDAWDPGQNIEGGARYLRILANQYQGDLVRTLAAYNAGPEAVRRAGGDVPNIPETREYVRKVVALYEAFKAGK
ncbi:lytic transglycosylase domain-containing protein [Anaeromyxobacter sp. Fw109-5]|uniref:lytic transglycosylase domain-containing protein n=1 Tax=Anaeromyxobacter sp. (strain Fw109-5) TaxID=404589 RepID=UPI0000ED6F94|nr:lytic transglycosylase domain-containing protein [Anaeromyxobacter sp. Fw109-5]ABS27865.1 Lytic transglycosylase catalytic [Anaeromyxobacter sp. Fw109-5]